MQGTQSINKELLTVCKLLVNKIREIDDEGANDGDGHFDTWQSFELQELIKLTDYVIQKAET